MVEVEVELKFQVPAAQRRRVDAAVAGRRAARRQRMQAAYFDTPERLLARHGLALRMRREGRAWVQTLKGDGIDGMTRQEHNVPLGDASDMPRIDLTRHAATPVGERLNGLLAAHAGAMLGTVYRTDVLRRTRLLRTRRGNVELAFDDGVIVAGEAEVAVCEFEIELVSGAPAAVIDSARRWIARHGLWLDTRSKAERGDLLARGERMAEARMARPLELARTMQVGQAWQQALRSCREQINVNASQIGSGDFGDEHVHQLRVGLRRLRSALRFFDVDEATTGALAEPAASLFRRLGAARDQAVLGAELAPSLDAAWSRASGDGEPAQRDRPWLPPAGDGTAVAAMVRETASQHLLLSLIELGLPLPPQAPVEPGTEGHARPPDLREALGRRLARWHRRAVADARRFDELDDAARHRLRRRIKRLRYAVDFCASLFPRGGVRRYLRAVRALQERLGALTDATMASAAFRASRDADARSAFALGWLSARHDRLLDDARPALRDFIKVGKFWKKG